MSLLRKHYAYPVENIKKEDLRIIVAFDSYRKYVWHRFREANESNTPYETQLYSSARFCSFYLSKQPFEIPDAQRVFRRSAND